MEYISIYFVKNDRNLFFLTIYPVGEKKVNDFLLLLSQKYYYFN